MIAGYVYAAIALLVAFLPYILGYLINPPRASSQKTDAPYECGFEPMGDARMPFFIAFYVVAILFVLFDLEMAFLVPWSMILKTHFSNDLLCTGWLFLLILCAGLYYEWKQGVFECLSSRSTDRPDTHSRG